MEQRIITGYSAQDLNSKIAKAIEEGFVPVGSHTVIKTHEQLRYAGMQHKGTVVEYEYTQTIRKD